jgi:hypothetical protein
MLPTVFAAPFADIAQINKAVGIACRIYSPETLLGSHVGNVFKSQVVGKTLPPLEDYSSLVRGLEEAILLFGTPFLSKEEFIAFLSNVLYESLCLTTTKETCENACSDQFYGRGFIQLTGRSNYQAFADFVNNQAIMTNPDLISDQYSWASAIYFWTRNCNRASNVGQGLACINNPECAATSTKSSIYFQYGPLYRLALAQSLSASLNAADLTEQSKQACPQMVYSLESTWKLFCETRNNKPNVCAKGIPEPVVIFPSNSTNAGKTAPSNHAVSFSVAIMPFFLIVLNF